MLTKFKLNYVYLKHLCKDLYCCKGPQTFPQMFSVEKKDVDLRCSSTPRGLKNQLLHFNRSIKTPLGYP